MLFLVWTAILQSPVNDCQNSFKTYFMHWMYFKTPCSPLESRIHGFIYNKSIDNTTSGLERHFVIFSWRSLEPILKVLATFVIFMLLGDYSIGI